MMRKTRRRLSSAKSRWYPWVSDIRPRSRFVRVWSKVGGGSRDALNREHPFWEDIFPELSEPFRGLTHSPSAGLVLYWIHIGATRFEGAMNVPVNLSIKNVPDHLAEALRLRAAASHRSMQGELMAILERALQEERQLTPAAVLARVRELAIRTDSEAVDMLRKDRNER